MATIVACFVDDLGLRKKYLLFLSVIQYTLFPALVDCASLAEHCIVCVRTCSTCTANEQATYR